MQPATEPAHGAAFEDPCCIFLGTETVHHKKADTTRVYDFWFCPAEPTLIARYGPMGDYKSNIAFIGHDAQIHRAFELLLDSPVVQDKDKRKVQLWYRYMLQERIEAQLKHLEWSDLERLLSITKEMR